MADEHAVEEARSYVRRSLETQRRLGYRSRVSKSVIEEAVAEAARALEPYLRLRRPPRDDPRRG